MGEEHEQGFFFVGSYANGFILSPLAGLSSSAGLSRLSINPRRGDTAQLNVIDCRCYPPLPARRTLQ